MYPALIADTTEQVTNLKKKQGCHQYYSNQSITICCISQQYCVIRIPYTRKMEMLHSFIDNGSSLTVAEILRRVSSILDLDKCIIEKETGYE